MALNKNLEIFVIYMITLKALVAILINKKALSELDIVTLSIKVYYLVFLILLLAFKAISIRF